MPVKIIIRSGDKQTTKSPQKIYLSWHEKKLVDFITLQDIFVKQGAGLFKTCDSTFV
jgi:hypothetical protein